MATVPDVCLGSAKIGANDVSLISKLFDIGGFRAAIVAGEYDQRVFRKPFRSSALVTSPSTLSVCITKSPYFPRPLFPCHSVVGKIGVCGEPSGTYKKNGLPRLARPSMYSTHFVVRRGKHVDLRVV